MIVASASSVAGRHSTQRRATVDLAGRRSPPSRSRGAGGVDRRARHRARRLVSRAGACASSVTPTYSGCPATEMIATLDPRAPGGDRRDRRRPRDAPVAAVDDRLDGARRQAQARGVRHRAAACRSERRSLDVTGISPLRRGGVVPCPRCGSARTTLAVAVRLDRVQGAVPLRRLPRAVRLLQAALAMSKFHPLSVARVERETRDAVAITFAVPDALREPFRYAQGQHLTLRADIGGADVRRSYSICSGGAGRRAAHRGQAESGRRVLDLGERGAEGGRRARRDAAARALQRAARRRGARATTWALPPAAASRRCCRSSRPRSPPSRAAAFTLFYGNRASGTVMFKEELAALKDTLPRPLQPRARALARGAGHRAPARPHRPREGRRAARALGRPRRTSTPCSSADPRA